MSRLVAARFALVFALAAVAGLVLAGSALARVEVVTKRHVSFKHYRTIQGAVDAAQSGDWILIDKGVYRGPVRITTSNLHVRGVDRNRVIVDGRHRSGSDGLNGIEVFKANNVWIENLTVRNFDQKTNGGHNGNEIWWNGGDGSGKIGASGWYGQYLTTYDTGLLGSYGLFVSNSVNGWMRHVYASGFNDSGIYIGACQDCNALVDQALVENNSLGYSGTNSGGHLILQNSTWRNNSFGIAPNPDPTGDQPAPQNGACNAGSNTSPTPTFPSTMVARCTIFRNNLVANNGNLTTPANGATLAGPWGIGFEWPGNYADLIDHNTITGNPNFGILGHEYPNPFPPTPSTIYFQISGNAFTNNTFSGNATRPGGADIGLQGGQFGSMQSVNNCFSGNTFGTSIPAAIEGTWGCQNATTPNGDSSGVLLTKLLSMITENTSLRHSVGQPPAPRQPTMPKPCRNVPRNPLCS